MKNLNSDFSHFVSGKEIERLGLVKDSHLRAYRTHKSKNGPPYLRIDGKPRYNPEEVRAWVEARAKRKQTSRYVKREVAEKWLQGLLADYAELKRICTQKQEELDRLKGETMPLGIAIAAISLLTAWL